MEGIIALGLVVLVGSAIWFWLIPLFEGRKPFRRYKLRKVCCYDKKDRSLVGWQMVKSYSDEHAIKRYYDGIGWDYKDELGYKVVPTDMDFGNHGEDISINNLREL